MNKIIIKQNQSRWCINWDVKLLCVGEARRRKLFGGAVLCAFCFSSKKLKLSLEAVKKTTKIKDAKIK